MYDIISSDNYSPNHWVQVKPTDGSMDITPIANQTYGRVLKTLNVHFSFLWAIY